MAITSLTSSPITKQLTRMRADLQDLQRQLATGKRADTFGTLGSERTLSVTFRAKVANLDAFKASIDNVSLRVKLLDRSMTRLSEVPTDVRAALDPNAYQVRLDGRTDAQKASRLALDEVLGLLNAEADGRYLFSGKSTDVKPVRTVDEILKGTPGLAGLEEVIAERWAADRGDAATTIGRLTTTVNAVGPAVDLAQVPAPVAPQTAANVEFGFRMLSAASVSFATLPVAGQSYKIDLGLPDGTTTSIELKATTSTPPGEREFLIGTGATPELDTATNFKAVLDTELTRLRDTELRSASAARASEMFFDTDGNQPPMRVAGGLATAATATGLVDGSSTTVRWYQGYDTAFDINDPSTHPRNDAVARVDSSLEVSYGARANETGFRQIVQALALTAVESFDSAVSADRERYRALLERSRDMLNFDGVQQDPRDIHAEIAIAGNVASRASERHNANKSTLQEMLDGVEGVQNEELAVQILTLQNRMQASYQTTAILNKLTLLNYL